MKKNPARPMITKILLDLGQEDPETRRILCTVDTHRHKSLARLTATHAIIELDQFYRFERRKNGKKFISGRHGQIGVNSDREFPGLGTKIVFSTGAGKHSVARDGANSDYFRGKNSCEISICLLIATNSFTAPVPNGLSTVDKSDLNKTGLILIKELYDFLYQKQITETSPTVLRGHKGFIIDEYVNKAIWLIQGFNNWNHSDPITSYEDEKCFESISKLFEATGRFQLCSCNNNCTLKKAVLSLMGLTLDFIQQIEVEFGELLPLTHFFIDESISIMLEYTKPSPNQVGVFIFDQRMPRHYVLNNQFTAEFLRSGMIHRDYIYGPQ